MRTLLLMGLLAGCAGQPPPPQVVYVQWRQPETVREAPPVFYQLPPIPAPVPAPAPAPAPVAAPVAAPPQVVQGPPAAPALPPLISRAEAAPIVKGVQPPVREFDPPRHDSVAVDQSCGFWRLSAFWCSNW